MAETEVQARRWAGDGALPGRVVAMARSLRVAGVPVSAAEITDAVASLPLLPLEERSALRDALATTLLKEPGFDRIFDRLFEAFFPARSAGGFGGEASSAQAEPADRSWGEPGDDVAELADALRSGDSQRLREIARGRVQRHGDVRPEARVGEDAYVYRAMKGLNMDAVRDKMREQEIGGEGRSALERRMIQGDITEQIEMFRRMLSDEVFSTLLDALGPEELAARQIQAPPDEIDFLWAQESDLDAMRAALAPLARRLAGRLVHKRRRARRGRLDLRRTIRRSLSAGGHPVDPQFRRPSASKPELVLLCDVSGSMRAFAKFTLELTYTLITHFQRVRTFVFVDTLDEVTEIFDEAGDMTTALSRVESEANVITFDGQSWYGNCLAQFWDRAGSELSPHSIVMVMGDARTNKRSTGVEHLRKVADRAGRVWWLNPEPREHWDTGDSEISAFAPACDAVHEVRNLRQLEEFAAGSL